MNRETGRQAGLTSILVYDLAECRKHKVLQTVNAKTHQYKQLMIKTHQYKQLMQRHISTNS